jgi:hypothetical protein
VAASGAGIAGSLVSAGTAAATGNYVSAGLSLLGLGISLFGGNEEAEARKKMAAVSQEKFQHEQEINDQREIQMQMSSRRQSLEIIRNTQRARAMGLQAAVSQGASKGSGYAGGQGEEASRGFFNLQGINQNLEIGENIFGINKLITQNNMKLSQLQTEVSEAQGTQSIGAGISKSADPLGRLSGQIFSSGPTTLGTPNGPTPFY